MSAVTKQEILEALRGDWDDSARLWFADRLEEHGIAPPDGIAVVKDEQSTRTVRYVPMAEAEFDELSAQWPGEDEVKIYCWEKHIEREVIRRAIAQGAKLEVQE